MRLKGCYGQFQTRGIGRETYGGLFRQSGAFMGGAFAGMGSRAGRITIEGFVTSSQVCRVFLDRDKGSGQPPSVIGVVIYFHEGDHSLGFLAHLGMASPSHVHKLVPTRLNDCPGSSQSIVQATRINDLYQVNDVCSIEPELLEKFAQAVPDALVGVANAEQKEPPGFRGVLKIFRSENLRCGLAVVNNLLEAWGRNFSTQRNS
jgi:hypothetical protein